jgi:hypothetical protein
MVYHRAFTEETLAELGWLTIIYSGLEDLLATFIGQLLNPRDQEHPGTCPGCDDLAERGVCRGDVARHSSADRPSQAILYQATLVRCGVGASLMIGS